MDDFTIKLKVAGLNIERDVEDETEIVENSRGVLTAQLDYDETWTGLSRMVIWTNGRTSVATVDRTGSVTVPLEVLKKGELAVSMVGLAGGGKRRLVTKAMGKPLTVLESGATEGQEEREATPSLAEQLVAQVQAALDELERAKADQGTQEAQPQEETEEEDDSDGDEAEDAEKAEETDGDG
jgi:hypothetical protein